jgi:16S rRNA (cytidine1402-2'-O)-methyltransferase
VPLLLVPTPLGNLRDITLRALDALREAALIVAEDTRVTHKLLEGHGISGQSMMAFHAHSPPSLIEKIIERAREEIVVAVSDAGMPGISDPGSDLVRAARDAGVTVEVLPGPCAFVSAAVLSGFPIVGLAFEGFVPRTGGARRKALAAALAGGRTTVWYESPHRIRDSLATLEELDPGSQVFVLREYTKFFEQQALGKPNAVNAALADPIRGEITMVLAASNTVDDPSLRSEDDLEARISALEAQQLKSTAIAKTLSLEGWGERSELYLRLIQRGKPDGDGSNED